MNKIQAQTAKRLLALAGSLLKTSGFSKRKVREAISNYLGDNLSFFEVSDKPTLVGEDHEWWHKGDKFFEVTIKDSSGRPAEGRVFHYNPTAHQLLDVREDDVEKDPITVR